MGVAYYAMLMLYLFPKLMGHQEITKLGDRRLGPGLGGPRDPMQAPRGLVFLSGMILLRRFVGEPKWTVIWPGRAARLSLAGPNGNLDIVVTYFHTGAEVTELDRFGVHPGDVAGCNSFRKLRELLRHRLAGIFAYGVQP